ncbi:MAG TPA: sulfate ABC transporter substrate-binding protein, partial [Anaerolineales bacterium]|nr:sulfate ABC transporter substrate-binding protein [Anaerolineales bacterium]
LAISLLAACAGPANTPAASSTGGTVKLTLAAYSTPSEAYAKIIPLFVADWKAKKNQDVTFEQSYGGSGAQSRAITGGLEADVAALSLEGDITSIVKAGLITRDWQSLAPNKAIVSTSVVAFAVRKGNPKNIHDWADLAQPGLQILTPDPKTSGGAQWNILALYGAALRGKVPGVAAGDEAAATKFLVSVLKNVIAFDKDARGSITNFESGNGDVAITYENEVLLGRQRGQDYELVIPSSTILIENPVAVVDVYSDKHGVTEVADAFVNFLFTKEAQQEFAKIGYRSTDPDVAAATASQFPKVSDLFTIGDEFGGWSQAKPKFFGDNGIYAQAIAEAQSK